MGTWGIKPFENDAASDWVWEFESSGLAAVNEALPLSNASYLEASKGEIVIAAAEVVAAAFGSSPQALPDDVQAALSTHRNAIRSDPAIKDKTRRAVDRVLAGESELLEVWGEADDFAIWRDGATELSRRLSSG